MCLRNLCVVGSSRVIDIHIFDRNPKRKRFFKLKYSIFLRLSHALLLFMIRSNMLGTLHFADIENLDKNHTIVVAALALFVHLSPQESSMGLYIQKPDQICLYHDVLTNSDSLRTFMVSGYCAVCSGFLLHTPPSGRCKCASQVWVNVAPTIMDVVVKSYWSAGWVECLFTNTTRYSRVAHVM